MLNVSRISSIHPCTVRVPHRSTQSCEFKERGHRTIAKLLRTISAIPLARKKRKKEVLVNDV